MAQIQTGWDGVGGEDSDSVSEEDGSCSGSAGDDAPAERPPVPAPVSSSLPISCEVGPASRRCQDLRHSMQLSSSLGDKSRISPDTHTSKVCTFLSIWGILGMCLARFH
jgi:hypothetical protein